MVDLSPSYLRAIESGAVPPPPYIALKLATGFGIDFSRCAALFVLGTTLDMREPGDKDADYKKINELARELALSFPAFKGFLEWVARTSAEELSRIAASGNSKVGGASNFEQDLEEGVTALIDFLRVRSDKVLNAPVDVANDKTMPAAVSTAVYESLSPVFADIVESLALRLSLFTPHINLKTHNRWEQINTQRVKAVYACLSYQLSASVLNEDKVAWAFIFGSPYKPTFHVNLLDENRHKWDEVKSDIRKGFYSVGSASTVTLSFSKRDDGMLKKFVGGLVFDFATRRLIAGDLTEAEVMAGKDSGSYKEFRNAWLYELAPDAQLFNLRDGAASQDAQESRFFAIVDDFHPEKRRNSYAISLEKSDVVRLLEYFHCVCESGNEPRVEQRAGERLGNAARGHED